MIVLMSASQVKEHLRKIFDELICEDFDLQSFFYENVSLENIGIIFNKPKSIIKKDNEVQELCELLFQMRDPKKPLSNFLKMILVTKNYRSVLIFFKRFVVGQFSVQSFSFSPEILNLQERLFERFLEVCEYCQIPKYIQANFCHYCFTVEENLTVHPWKRVAKIYFESLPEECKISLGKVSVEQSFALNTDNIATEVVKVVESPKTLYTEKSFIERASNYSFVNKQLFDIPFSSINLEYLSTNRCKDHEIAYLCDIIKCDFNEENISCQTELKNIFNKESLLKFVFILQKNLFLRKNFL